MRYYWYKTYTAVYITSAMLYPNICKVWSPTRLPVLCQIQNVMGARLCKCVYNLGHEVETAAWQALAANTAAEALTDRLPRRPEVRGRRRCETSDLLSVRILQPVARLISIPFWFPTGSNQGVGAGKSSF